MALRALPEAAAGSGMWPPWLTLASVMGEGPEVTAVSASRKLKSRAT